MCEINHMRMHPGHGRMGMHQRPGGMGMRPEQCRCGCHSGFSRHLQTKQEKITRLEEYRQQLELELQALKEHLEFLTGK